jgi:hypothetical protein
VIFQTYKNAVLRSVHSLGLFWLCFYPCNNQKNSRLFINYQDITKMKY